MRVSNPLLSCVARICWALGCLVALTTAAPLHEPHRLFADDQPAAAVKPIRFSTEVLPLLKQHCFRCHAGRDAESGVRLDVRRSLLGETDGHVLVVVGASDSSRLIHAVERRDARLAMPPAGEGEPLTNEQIGLLRAWIDQGLPWDDQALPPPPTTSDHWAFQPIVTPAIPTVRGRGGAGPGRDEPKQLETAPHTAIDAFLAVEQQRLGVTFSPPASRVALMRRLALVLLGLPPAAEDLQEFVDDERPDAYERLVDRWLASPRYGERWGRHWLDLARWAESEGYESNHPRPYAWRYRDYVVNAFNRDLPYDQFLREQIAGDEIPQCTDEQLIATGFLAAARLSSNEEDKALQRNAVLVDIVNTVGESVLGLTLGCAQCHNHKIDPLTQRDYYRLQAFFVRGQPNNLVLRDPDGTRQFQAAKPAEYDPAIQLLQTIHDRTRERLLRERRDALSNTQREALDTPPANRTAAQHELARQADLELQVLTSQIERALDGDDKMLYDALKKKIAAIEKNLPDRPQTWGYFSPATASATVDILPMKGFYPLPYEPEELRRTPAFLLIRGDVHRRGPVVEPGWPEVLETPPPTGPANENATKQRARSALVDWLVARQQPLTARVWANRIWHYQFGRGLVTTPGDFGRSGGPPSHPELLDWLAGQLLDHGWSTKQLQRQIVLSTAFRQSARQQQLGQERDPDNVSLWRWRARRLEAEAIRDALLATSGQLTHAGGGKSDDEKMSNRRGLYVFQKRDQLPEVQRLFDGASANEPCSRRHVSTVSLQPLYLLNSPFAVEQARQFARRVEREVGSEPRRQVERAFLLALGRTPSTIEASESLRLFDESSVASSAVGSGAVGSDEAGQGSWSPLELLCQALLNLNEFLQVP